MFPATTSAPAATVGDVILTDKLPAPVRGGTPVTYFSAPEYTGSAAWSVSSGGQALGGVFEAGTTYTATVTLTAVSGCTFNGVGANAFIHGGASSVSNTAGSGLVVITFPATSGVPTTMASDRDLTYKLPAPVRSGTPVVYFSSLQYTGQVDWLAGGVSAPHSVFQSNMAYTAQVTLTAAPGYTLGNPAAAFTHSGASAITTTTTGTAVIVNILFPATTSVAALTVSDLNLTSKIPAPVWGGTPAVYFSAPQYTGSVAWKRTDTNAALEDLFGTDTAYTATVTLTAVSGYTFAGVEANAFTCGGASTVTNSADSGAVTITFPMTNSTPVAMVIDWDLTYKLPVPVRGGTPITYFSDPQYTGNVAWSVTAGGQSLRGLFEGGTAYTATVTLTAVSGYTFNGVGANAFTHSGAVGPVTNAANTGVVTIPFPATASVTAAAVSDLDLTAKLPSPVMGGTAVTYFSAPQYTGTVDWSVTSGSPHSGVFGAATAYTATVTLTAASDYTFTGVGVNSFTHAAGTAANGANSGVVAIAFPATGSVAATVVSDLNLTAKVPSPVSGGTPVSYFFAPQYSGTVAWKRSDTNAALGGLFGQGTAYTATVTLTAVSGYTLAGVSGNFTHTGGALSITAAAGDNGTVTVTIAFRPTDSTAALKVLDLDLTAKVPKPVWDGTPVTYFSAAQYTGTVAWSGTVSGQPLTGLFGDATAYTAAVTLTAASGYTLTGVVANTFDHSGKSTITNLADSGAVTITFPATSGSQAAMVNTDLDLMGKVAVPVLNGTPTTYFAAAQYTGTVAWKRTDNNAALCGLFAANTAYTATVTLTAASGYTLEGLGANAFTYTAGALSITHATSDIVTITFPATEGEMAFTVFDLDLTYRVSAPVRGGTPRTYFSALQYTGNVAWKRTDNNAALTGLFEAGTAYTATVTLTAAAGYTLAGVGVNAFAHAGKSTISNGASSGVVTITFPATDSVAAIAITSVNLAGFVPVPVTGATPVTTFNAGTYSGTMAWTNTGGVTVTFFEADTVYRATVTLYPAAGYYFPATVPVTLGGISASFSGEPRKGTLTFPETGALLFFNGPFSGSSTVDMDSAIDLIRATKEAGHSSLYLSLSPRTETASLAAGTDLGAGGLSLTTANSPANVAIDGGRRTVQLTGTGTGSLITVGSGVTLTLRNITLVSNSLVNGSLLVNVASGGRLILETGAVLQYDLATGGTVGYEPVAGNSSKVWETHTFTQSGALNFGITIAVAADYLIVAGGGGAGGDQNSNINTDFSGGGGAGGLMYKTGQTLSPQGGVVQISVGAGGAGGQRQAQGADGGMSAIGSIVVPGGGGGGGAYSNMNGRSGGSGGGGGAGNGSSHGSGGARSSVDSEILGNIGGNGAGSTSGSSDSGGGGGGARGQGTDSPGSSYNALAGGAPWNAAAEGASWLVGATGTAEFSRGGNGGGRDAPQGGTAGVNYGDGGAGGNNRQQPGGAGHSGIVVIRFQRLNVGVN
jgi:hypothetical protein